MDLPTVTKTSYMLGCKELERLVQTYDRITLAGVVTDICVLQNAIGLYNQAANSGRAITLAIRQDCVASFDPDGHAYALAYMNEKLGFQLI